MVFWSVVLFFLISYGFGFTLSALVKKKKEKIEKTDLESILMRIGLGFGAWAIIVVLLSIVKVPVNIYIYFVLSMLYPVYYLSLSFKEKKKIKITTPSLKIKKNTLYAAVMLLLFLGTFYMMHTGTFAYPYLEDGDPWEEHAAGIKYVKETQQIYRPADMRDVWFIHYLPPYPPAYDAIIGTLHQLTVSTSWTLKFFNALMISMSVIFFFYFARELTGRNDKALFATFGFAAIPCFLSHFIWASSLALMLYPVAFYALLKIKENRNWRYVAGVVIAGILVSQPSNALIFGLLFGVYALFQWIATKKFPVDIAVAGVGGFAVSFIYWGLMLARYGVDEVMRMMAVGGKSLLNLSGSGAGMFFTFKDYAIATPVNKINNPVGVGVVLFGLFFIGLLYVIFKYKTLLTEKNVYLSILTVWSLMAILGIQSNSLPITFMPHRWWAILAIPLVLLAAEGVFFLVGLFKKEAKIVGYIILIVAIVGIFMTSASPKYQINTSQWSFGGMYRSAEDMQGHLWMKQNFPPDTKVFSVCARDEKIIGLDMYSEQWDREVYDFREEFWTKTPDELNAFLDKKGYQYFVFGGNCIHQYGQKKTVNETVEKINEMGESGLFPVVLQVPSVVIFQNLPN